MIIRNLSQGARGVNVGQGDHVEALMIPPGATSPDVELTNPNCRVFLGMIAARELEVVAQPASAPVEAEQPAAAAAPAEAAAPAAPAAPVADSPATDKKTKG